MSFGKNIKKLRRNANMTQEQLAALLSISPQAISRWETDVAMPDVSLLPALANTFHVTTDFLLDIDPDANQEKIVSIVKYPLPPEGTPFMQHLDTVRELCRNNPTNTDIKESMMTLFVIYFSGGKDHQTPDLLIEFRNLCMNLLNADISNNKKQHITGFLAAFCGESMAETEDNLETIIGNHEIDSCKEVLLPCFTTGEARVEANKNLIFECACRMTEAIYNMYKDIDYLTAQEVQHLEQIRGILEFLYDKETEKWVLTPSTRIPRIEAYCSLKEYGTAIDAVEETLQHMEEMAQSKAVEFNSMMPKGNDIVNLFSKRIGVVDILLSRETKDLRKFVCEKFSDDVMTSEMRAVFTKRLDAIENIETGL